jgi:hypothetical protein
MFLIRFFFQLEQPTLKLRADTESFFEKRSEMQKRFGVDHVVSSFFQ